MPQLPPTTAIIVTVVLSGSLLVPGGAIEARELTRPISFELDVQPILTAQGCNSGPCHGKQRGQNGFQLSLFGFDPDYDFAALTQESRGRRVFPSAPRQSLLLKKATGELPHGGGQRIAAEDDDYKTLLTWIQQGLLRRVADEPQLARVAVDPPQPRLKPDEQLQLRVTAFYSDGSQRDVTSRTTYQSNESGVAAVNRTGLITAGPAAGSTAIMARYMNEITVAHVSIPVDGTVPKELYASLPRRSFVDQHIWQKLETLGLTPSKSIAEEKLLRRIYLDTTGRLPRPEEIREYISNTDPAKLERVVDNLLDSAEYIDYWSNKWADLLRPNPYRVGIKTVLSYDNWIREQFRQNKKYDEFVRDLVTARGSVWENGAATLYRDRRSPDELTTIVSQLFLGIRLECAKCHHHPFERWGQDHFFSFAAYFARVGRKGRGLSPPISGSEEIVLISDKGEVKHPVTGETLAPRPLFGEATTSVEKADPRVTLAQWLTSKENDYFAKVQVNRVWADLMGRGIVEPVDDLRSTNPPTNAALLDSLANYFRHHDFDQKKLIREIVLSHAYRLSSIPTDRNASDKRNYSRHYRRRMRAEALLDAVAQITGTPNKFGAMPPESRATQIWTHRIGSLFLDTFGRPDPNQDPPCERDASATMTQTLHLMNAPDLHRRVTSDDGNAAKLAASDMSIDEIVEQLYLLVYSRFPDEEERTLGRKLFEEQHASRRSATEDLMWALLNTPEFFIED